MKYKKGDNVIVIAGGSKGKTGQIVGLKAEGKKVLVEGVNIKIKHRKPLNGTAGARLEKEFPIDISNIALKDSQGKPSRVGYKTINDKKVRIYKTTGEEVK